MGRLFVVDTENTNDYSFIHNYEINKEDEIVLFVSNNMKGIKADGCIALLNTEGNVITEKIETGEKNSLDFQLIAYVTERAINGSYDEILINTRDHGYRQVIKYIQRKYYENISIVSREGIRKQLNNKTLEQDTKVNEENNLHEVNINKEENTIQNVENTVNENNEIEKTIKEENKIENETIEESKLDNEEKVERKQVKKRTTRKKQPVKNHNEPPVEKKVEEIIKSIVPDATDDQINNILKMKSKTLLLRNLHDELLKTFREDGKKIYGEIKGYMKK